VIRGIAGYQYQDGVFFPDTNAGAMSREQSRMTVSYNSQATDDIVRATSAQEGGGREDYYTLVSPNVLLWRNLFPEGCKVPTVLEMGCGFGRIPLYLSTQEGFTCNTYYGVDISHVMLQAFHRYRERSKSLPSAECNLICQLAESRLPLPDNSIDLVTSCALYNHMGKSAIQASLNEVGRVLKLGGGVFLDRSFANWWNPGALHIRLRRLVPVGLAVHRTRFFHTVRS
jgi:SAM-dependent methyltransferase